MFSELEEAFQEFFEYSYKKQFAILRNGGILLENKEPKNKKWRRKR